MKFRTKNLIEVKSFLRTKSSSWGTLTLLMAFLLISEQALSGGPGFRRSNNKVKPVIQKVGTFVLTYSPKSLIPSKGAKKITPSTELKSLLDSEAKLKTDRPLEYRNQIIMAGEHTVKMIKEKKSYYFILGTPPLKATKQKPSKKKRSTEKKLETSGKTMGLAEREKNSEKKKKGGSSGTNKKKVNTKEQSWLKARVFFSVPRVVKANSKVSFKLETTSGGQKLRLIAQAGKTLGKATFKVHPKEVKSARKGRKRG